MSRMTALVTRLENVSKKMGVELEHVLDILEGKSATHKVVQTSTPAPATVTDQNGNKLEIGTTAGNAEVARQAVETKKAEALAAEAAKKANPTGSGLAAASGAQATQAAAGSTAAVSAQNKAAANSGIDDLLK